MIPDLADIAADDNAFVFLDLHDFAETKTILLWRKGYHPGNPEFDPDELTIPVVIDVDGTKSAKWQKNSQRAKAGSTIMYQKDDTAIYTKEIHVFAMLKDFGIRPRKGQRLAFDDNPYKITDVRLDMGMLEITLSEFTD